MKRRSLFSKYVVVFVLLVTGALLTSGLLQLDFSYQENQAELIAVQREKAAGAATRIEAFLSEIERLMTGAVGPSATTETMAPDQRRNDLLRLLRQAPAILEVSYVDGNGGEQLRLSRIALSVTNSGADRSQEPSFINTRAGKTYYGPIYFRNGSEPYMTLAVPSAGTAGGAIVAEVNLKFIWDVVARIQVGKAGYAYVVDANGELIAHPDISLVLSRPDLTSLPQIQAISSSPSAIADEPSLARDLQGRSVLTARAAIDPPGWSIFVEQPLDEAFAPLYASLLRTALLLVAGLVLSVVASLILARRMVKPIRALQAGTARVGAGALDSRIEVHTGDELEALADDFNRMSLQLHELYGTLEARVEERTRDLATAKEQVEVADRHKSVFLASMSHELRTPLNAIIGFSDALSEQFFGPLNPRQTRYVQHILTSGRHLLALINDVLDLSKVEAGRMELELDRFSVADVLNDGVTMLKERASRNGITMSICVEPGAQSIHADKRKVKQVVFNLLTNAVKFTPDGGRVSVEARRSSGWVEVAVRDTGIGIALEDQARIFDAFQQGDQGRAIAREGTGLGLTLSRQFAELHGGRLWVESTLNEGSTFIFALPAMQGPMEGSTPDQASEEMEVNNGGG